MPEQLSLTLPVRPALGRDDFFVSPANVMALGLIDMWPNWPGSKLLLVGPKGSGKTHLTHVWATQSNAVILNARDLSEDRIPDLAKGPVAVENVPDIAGDVAAQKALFHLHNLTLAEGNTLLLTGAGEPNHWQLELPDLQSRMQGTTVAALEQPDDILLSVIMAKQFADRQLTPHPDTIPYLVKNMDRSFEGARRLVEALDRLSLAEQRPITRALAKRVLDATV
ncbi:MAG: DnaA/Hda family protein [Shimia thalassica]|uniref:DnaA ATPase domain-containing protein n=1 Tax=Shimia thalassica TaxID=1715693 RepID=UPI002734C80F|nr:DnaA/Hda family protein [Shimia thalassica]MDP2518014.1 DnaA/Hda family protein [Shimia thalassica]